MRSLRWKCGVYTKGETTRNEADEGCPVYQEPGGETDMEGRGQRKTPEQ